MLIKFSIFEFELIIFLKENISEHINFMTLFFRSVSCFERGDVLVLEPISISRFLKSAEITHNLTFAEEECVQSRKILLSVSVYKMVHMYSGKVGQVKCNTFNMLSMLSKKTADNILKWFVLLLFFFFIFFFFFFSQKNMLWYFVKIVSLKCKNLFSGTK